MLHRIGVFVERRGDSVDACRPPTEAIQECFQISAVILGETVGVDTEEFARLVAECYREIALVDLGEVANALQKRVRDTRSRAASRRNVFNNLLWRFQIKQECRTANDVAQGVLIIEVQLVVAPTSVKGGSASSTVRADGPFPRTRSRCPDSRAG